MATRNLVPNHTNEGEIGTALTKWHKVNTENIDTTNHNFRMNSYITVPIGIETFTAEPVKENIRKFQDVDPLSSTLFNKITQQIVNRIEYNAHQLELEQEATENKFLSVKDSLLELKEELLYGAIQYEYIIPQNSWTEIPDDMYIPGNRESSYGGMYKYYSEIHLDRVTEDVIPLIFVSPADMEVAILSGFCPTCQSLAQTVRVFSRRIPNSDLSTTINLLNVKVVNEEMSTLDVNAATETKLGLVKIGEGISVTNDGLISINSEKVLIKEDIVNETEAEQTLKDTLDS